MFVSVVVMFRMMFKYKEVVSRCFGAQSDRNLRNRVPDNETCDVVEAVVDTLDQLVISCLVSQKKTWTVSEAVAHFAKV